MKSPITEVVFKVYNNVSFMEDSSKQIRYQIPVGLSFRMLGMLEDRAAIIKCVNGTSLIIHGYDQPGNSLYLENFTIIGCGQNPNIGLLLHTLNNVALTGSTFNQMTGVQLVNIENIDVKQCQFTDNTITPTAALSVSYDNVTVLESEKVVVNIIETDFLMNSQDPSFPVMPGQSGVVSIALTKLRDSNHTFNITLRFCNINANKFHMKAAQAPVLYISQITNQNINFTMDHCLFQHNYFVLSVQTMISPTDVIKGAVNFLNNIFENNTDPYGNYGLLRISTIHLHETPLVFLYAQNNFISNNGTCLYIDSNGHSSHSLIGNRFRLNVGHLVDSHVIYASGNGSRNSKGDYDTLLQVNNLNMYSNGIKNDPSHGISTKTAVMFVRWVKFNASQLIFAYNTYYGPNPVSGFSGSISTALSLQSVQTTISDSNRFVANRGTHGGAIAIREYNSSYPMTFNTTPNSLISFQNNFADYGGAVYVDSDSFVQSIDTTSSGLCLGTFNFSNNNARVAGQDVYTTSTELPEISIGYFRCAQYFNVHVPYAFTTSPKKFKISEEPISVVPGQSIIIHNVTLEDTLGNPSACRGDVNLYCDTDICEQTDIGIRLVGPPQVYLSGINEDIDTQLSVVRSNNSLISSTNIQPFLYFVCVEPLLDKVIKIPLSINSNCPNGFSYNERNGTCHCVSGDQSYFKCSSSSAVACVKSGYWVGPSDNNDKSVITVLPCPYPFCQLPSKNAACSIDSEGDMVLLPKNVDDQCASNRGGILCSKCRSGYYFTFQGVTCTQNCKQVYPYIIILLAFLFQLIIFVILLAVVRLKLETGSGFLYGPLLFLAVAGQLPYGYYFKFKSLEIVVDIFTSLYLLDLEVLGQIPWCFGKFDPLLAQSFYYLGPLLVWIMLVILACISHCCPRLVSKIQESPIQAICLLVMLSFWSLTNTNYRMLLPLKVGNEYRADIHPETKYFHQWHILLVIVAIFFLIVITVPFIIILGLSNIRTLYRKFRLYRLKPLLDEFQSCYHDNYRWYCVVYYITWLVYIVCSQYPYGAQIVLVLILTLHFVFQPYRRHLLNIIDMVLLLDLLLLASLLQPSKMYDQNSLIQSVLVYTLTLCPLAYIFIGCLAILMVQIYRRCYCASTMCCPNFIEHKVNEYTASVQENTTRNHDSFQEREPLIRAMQENSYNDP